MYFIFVTIIVYAIEVMAAYIFFSSATERKYKPSQCFFIGGALFTVALLVNLLLKQVVWLNFACYTLSNILFALLCFKLKIKKAFFYGFIITLIGIIWEVLIELVLASQNVVSMVENLYSDFALTILGLASKVLLLISVLILSRFIVKESNFKVPLSFLIYPFALMISLVAFCYICAYCDVNSTGQIALAIISLILIVPTTLLFLIYQRSIEKETELLRLKTEVEKVETEKTYYSIIEKQNENLRTYADDAQNHLEAIRNLNSDPQIEEYINKMSERLIEYSGEKTNK